MADGIVVIMIRDDVGIAQLKVVEWLEIIGLAPDAGGQRLRGLALAVSR